MDGKKLPGSPKFMEPVLGGSKPFLSTLPTPSERVLQSNWLIYKIPDWLDDSTVNNCLSCDAKFSILNRRVRFWSCFVENLKLISIYSIIVVLVEGCFVQTAHLLHCHCLNLVLNVLNVYVKSAS